MSALTRFEVGLVSADRTLVDFLAHVFELDALEPAVHPVGTLHRFASPGAVIKVMVPNEPPKPGDGGPFLAAVGIRYLSMWVADLDRVLERATARGATLLFGPFAHEPGGRLAVIQDPDGNTIEVIEDTSEGRR